MKYEQNMKEMQEEGFIEPEGKELRATTKGKFSVHLNNCADNFKTDLKWKIKANP